jgi:hypothetical protein
MKTTSPTIRFNMTHYLDVLRAKSAHSDAQGAKATRYTSRALSALVGQINERFMARFMEAL